jgi:hypothetical protein
MELPLAQGGNPIPQNASWKRYMPSLMILMQWKTKNCNRKLKILLYLLKGDTDTLSYKDAMGAVDYPEFKTDMVKEANGHTIRGTWGVLGEKKCV